jgi:hypothetical protein
MARAHNGERRLGTASNSGVRAARHCGWLNITTPSAEEPEREGKAHRGV